MWPFVSSLFHLALCLVVHSCYNVLHSLLWTDNMPLFVHTTICVSVHPLLDVRLFSICPLALANNAAMNMSLLAILLGIYLGVELMGHLEELPNCFPK